MSKKTSSAPFLKYRGIFFSWLSVSLERPDDFIINFCPFPFYFEKRLNGMKDNISNYLKIPDSSVGILHYLAAKSFSDAWKFFNNT